MGIEIIRPEVIETTALGAAYAAGIAVGVWKSPDDVRNKWRENHRWSSTLDPNLRAKKYAQWTKAVQRTLNWIE
jgi:glycerol kinase